MSKKRKSYSTAFKVKVVLEILKGEETLSQIASKYNILPRNLQKWRKDFLSNAELAMEPSKAVKEYKEQVKELEKKLEKYAKTVGKLTVERDWALGKLKSLDLSIKREMAGVQAEKEEKISPSRKCELLGISRSFLYYVPQENKKKELLKKRLQELSEDEFMCVYGEKKVHSQLLREGYKVSLNTVSKYRHELRIKAILAVKPIHTSIRDNSHKKYSYKLREIEIDRPNKVWSTDITYVRLKGGIVYFAAIIDWYSKAVLSWGISNTMETDFVMEVLDKALESYPKPEIFNTDQGSQYTSVLHTQALKDSGITISMDSKGRATDNIAIERFWRSVKSERIYLNDYQSIRELKEDIGKYIEFYNYIRLHQSLDYKSPMEVYDRRRYNLYRTSKANINNENYNFKEKVA